VKVMSSNTKMHSLQVTNLQKDLNASRKKTNSLQTKLWQLKSRGKKADRSNWPMAKQTMEVQALVNGYQQDAVKALEETDGLKTMVLQLREANVSVMTRLKLTEDKLQ
jgi:hypothetical protein